MPSISLTIDGRRARVPEGTTIMQAAQSLGIEIPSLCYHPSVPPQSSCRLCLVEIEGVETLQTSCSTAVRQGMVVHTNNDRVRDARRTILELLLSDHPVNCISCDLNGKCKLQRYAYEYQVREGAFAGQRHEGYEDATNPFFVRDLSKCISCGLCVAVCEGVQDNGAISIGHRGFSALPVTSFDMPLEQTNCVFCGNCVAVCPVGALIPKSRVGQGRDFELARVETVCPYCGCGCGMILGVKDGRILEAESPPEHPASNGWMCLKGRFGWDFVHHPDRLKTPLVRRGDKLQEASWDEALDLAARRLAEIRDRHGPDSLAVLTSAKCTNEENYLLQKFARVVLGTNNVDHCARLCHASTVAGLAIAFGSGAMTNSIAEFRNADCILVTGSNTAEAHPIVALHIKAAVKENGAKLIVADPRWVRELGERAALVVQHRGGTDIALFNGVMHLIIREGWHDEQFIRERTEGFEALKAALQEYPPERVAKITGVSEKDLYELARIYGTAQRAMICYAMGITQHTTGTQNVLTLANLAMLTGNVGRESTGVNPLRGQNNVQGACDVGALPSVFPGYQKVTDPEIRAKFEQAWGANLPAEVGLTVVEMFHAVERDGVRGMWIMGENPALSDPNANRVREALGKLDLLICQDIFLSETAEFADIVFPAASFAEKDGTYTSTERRVQRLRAAVPPPGSARPDWEIICEVARHMGHDWKYSGPGKVMDEIAQVTPIYGGISYRRLGRFGLCWPCPDASHPGTKFLHQGKFTRGLGLFTPTEHLEPAELPDDEYPLLLNTGRVLQHFHTGTMTRRSQGLDALYPQGFIELHPLDARALGLQDGDWVEVASRRGRVVVACTVTDRVVEGTTFLPFHFKEAAANLLTIDALDPTAKIPEYKVCAVRVQKWQEDAAG